MPDTFLSKILCFVLTAFFVAGTPGQDARAQNFPSKPVTLVVPFPAGGAADSIARMLAEHLTAAWKQPVVVDNRPGANSIVGTSYVTAARPDGYTLLFGTPSLSSFKALVANPPIDVLKDLAPISEIVRGPYILAVSPRLPVTTVAELVAYAKANPGKLNYGALAGGQTLSFEYLKQIAGLDIVAINYKGDAPTVAALAANEIQTTLSSPVVILPALDLGIKALAVTSDTRASNAPTIPTMAESGFPGFNIGIWLGILGPAQMPSDVRQKIADEIAVFVAKDDVKRRLQQFGYTGRASTPEAFTTFIDSDIQRLTQVARTAGIKPE